VQLPNNGAQRTEHPLTDHFGPFPLQQVAVLHRELAEVDASFGPPRFLSADALRPRVQGCLAARPSCVHLTESTGPSSSFRLAARPSCVHLTESTDPSTSFRLAARPSCVHLTESTSPSSSFVPRPLEQPRSVGGDCENRRGCNCQTMARNAPNTYSWTILAPCPFSRSRFFTVNSPRLMHPSGRRGSCPPTRSVLVFKFAWPRGIAAYT